MKERIAAVSVLVNLVLAVSKIAVGFIANSAAVLAEGLHSATDILSSGISFFGIRAGSKPPDKQHPYGHYKFEVFAGLFITMILFVTGIGIIWESYESYLNPGIVSIGYISLGVMLFSAAVNGIMSKAKIHYGKEENSLSLLSDGYHSRIDVYTSLGVLFGLVLTHFWIYADSVLAALIGVYIIIQAVSLGRDATSSLLDVSAGDETENKVREIVKKKRIEISDLKTQKKGSSITANLEIRLPSRLSVEEAARISNELKENLVSGIENLTYVAIQIKSHDVSTGYFKPPIGRGFGWQGRGKFIDKISEAKGTGPGGYCRCPSCGYKVRHKTGVPCSGIKCPRCNIILVRERDAQA